MHYSINENAKRNLAGSFTKTLQLFVSFGALIAVVMKSSVF
jgi:hypothetical protein